MLVGIDKLKRLIRDGLIEGLEENELNIEGCGIDLRLGEVYEMEDGEGKLLIETRDTPKFKLIAKYEKGKSIRVNLEPGKVYLGKTIEKINTPQNLLGWFLPRSTFYRCGIIVQGIRTDPGYKGEFTFMMSNISNRPFEIELGARIASMVFLEISGKTNLYKGQWQGGRVFIEGEERQTKQK
ncbi:MAG: hypothetical protein QW641_02370 [Candidatus Aenigmatarchaeota archaeon]